MMNPPRGLRPRFWVQAGLSALTAVLALLTLLVPDWIEELTGLRPDSGTGEAEWLVVGVLVLVLVAGSAGLAAGARREWRRATAAGT
jgi:hypothetical protein